MYNFFDQGNNLFNEDNSTDENTSYSEEELKNYDLKLASLENLGGAITAIGYLLISFAGKKEYYNILSNSTSIPSPTQLLLNGQTLIVIGYYILWIVATDRAVILQIRESNLASAQKKIAAYYLISIIANALRLEGFLEIYNDENNN